MGDLQQRSEMVSSTMCTHDTHDHMIQPTSIKCMDVLIESDMSRGSLSQGPSCTQTPVELSQQMLLPRNSLTIGMSTLDQKSSHTNHSDIHEMCGHYSSKIQPVHIASTPAFLLWSLEGTHVPLGLGGGLQYNLNRAFGFIHCRDAWAPFTCKRSAASCQETVAVFLLPQCIMWTAWSVMCQESSVNSKAHASTSKAGRARVGPSMLQA